MIIVCGLHDVHEQIALHGVTSMIGILSPSMAHPECKAIAEDQRLRLSFHDINHEADGLQTAKQSDVQRLLQFLQNWNQVNPLLIHCWAGISRSTATAFAAMCLLNPEVDEFELARRLRVASPSATPNRLITGLVDQHLGRAGRMVAAIESIGRGEDAFSGRPFKL